MGTREIFIIGTHTVQYELGYQTKRTAQIKNCAFYEKTSFSKVRNSPLHFQHFW
jgi:hypothetical protein